MCAPHFSSRSISSCDRDDDIDTGTFQTPELSCSAENLRRGAGTEQRGSEFEFADRPGWAPGSGSIPDRTEAPGEARRRSEKRGDTLSAYASDAPSKRSRADAATPRDMLVASLYHHPYLVLLPVVPMIRSVTDQPTLPVYRAILALLLSAVVAGVAVVRPAGGIGAEPVRLPPVAALGVQLDTLLLGGYASGSFGEAVETLGGDLSALERLLIGQHLDRIFADVVSEDGLGRSGRLRLAYERATRPDGTTRSIRVLGAELASSGRVHTAYYFEAAGGGGYYDAFGRPLDSSAHLAPVRVARVSSPFGNSRLHPILQRYLPHTGVDYAAAAGDPVVATSDGIVLAAGDRGGYGLLVELQHPDGHGTRYAHLSRIADGVAPSRPVVRGQVIGYVGATGLATGPHLHYEVRRRGQPVDPELARRATLFGTGVGGEGGWSEERRRIATLLARAPAVARFARAS